MPDTDTTLTDIDTGAWERALDQLEASLGASARDTAAILHGDDLVETVAWIVPGRLGPLPAALADRARELLAGQRELIAELEEARHQTALQLAAVLSVPGMRAPGASVYLDVTG